MKGTPSPASSTGTWPGPPRRCTSWRSSPGPACPLWGDPDPAVAAPRLAAIAGAYGDGALTPRRILRAVPGRLRAMYDSLSAAAAAGDAGLTRHATPAWRAGAAAKLAALAARLPAIERLLPG